MTIKCKQCDNPFGEVKNNKINLLSNRLNEVQIDIVENHTSFKCRKCGSFSVIRYSDTLELDLDYVRTSKETLSI